MKTTARTGARATRPASRSPLSVTLSPQLRRRLTRVAKERQLKAATTARVLIDERITQLEDEAQLTKSEEWQRAQAWATWEKIEAGDTREVSWQRLKDDTAKAIERARRKAQAKTKAS